MPDIQRYRLSALNAQHPVQAFRCEEDDFNEYLRNGALSDSERGLALTFVEIDEEKPATENVAGFFTLRADALHIRSDYFEDFPEGEEDSTGYGTVKVPLAELMYLARDLRWKGLGLGDTLMVDVLKTVMGAVDRLGLIGLHLRSTPRGVRLYSRYDFQLFKEHPTFDEARYILPILDIRNYVDKLREEEV